MFMPKMGAAHMPKRPRQITPASPNLNNTEVLMVPCRGESKLVVQGHEMDSNRLAIIDSGCSSDNPPIDLALHIFPTKIHQLIKSIAFETAANDFVCARGATVQFGPWDVALDVCLSPGAPALISVGQRVMETGMSLFWLPGKKPCMITDGLRYIVISEN